MMSTTGKLNRSYSESELPKLNFEDLCVQDYGPQSTNFERRIPFVKKTVLIFEEVGVRYGSPVTLRSGQSIPNQLHNINLYANNFMLSDINSTNNSNIRLNSETPIIAFANQHLTSHRNDNHEENMPMDIDTHCNKSKVEELNIEKMDIDPDHRHYQTESLNKLDRMLKNRKYKREPIILSEQVSLENNTQLKPIIISERKQLSCSTIIFALIALLIFSWIWFFQSNVIFANSDIQLQNIKKDLLENVYEQKGPVSVIVRSLEHRQHWANKIKTLGFIGPTGVGKTFIANILKKHFHQGLVHELYGIQLSYKDQWGKILNNINSCCLNLIIIDDLNKKDTTELFALAHSLPKNCYILVISIFNIQYLDNNQDHVISYNDINEIRLEFDNSGLFHELAIFHQFNTYQVKDWLEKQLKVQNLKYCENTIQNLLYNHNASYEGLKGLYPKLSLELERRVE